MSIGVLTGKHDQSGNDAVQGCLTLKDLQIAGVSQSPDAVIPPSVHVHSIFWQVKVISFCIRDILRLKRSIEKVVERLPRLSVCVDRWALRRPKRYGRRPCNERLWEANYEVRREWKTEDEPCPATGWMWPGSNTLCSMRGRADAVRRCKSRRSESCRRKAGELSNRVSHQYYAAERRE